MTLGHPNLGHAKLRALLIALLLVGIWGASVRIQQNIDPRISGYRESPETLWLGSGKLLRILSLGHDGLLADIYWTRAVQYYGSRLRDKKTDFSLLSPLLDITVALDPQLLIAYYFGGFFLSSPAPRGAGRPDQAVDLLQRGIAANPDAWRLWHHLGFTYYWELQEYENAAAAYLEGSKHPDARSWMKVMAASITARGGNLETSRFLWQEIYNSTEDETIRNNARMQLEGLQARADMEEIESLVEIFRERAGRAPASLAELVSARLMAGVPLDPAGYPYRLTPESEVVLHPDSTVQLVSGLAPPGAR